MKRRESCPGPFKFLIPSEDENLCEFTLLPVTQDKFAERRESCSTDSANMRKIWYIYVCNKNGKLYTGITTDIGHRMNQHRAAVLYSETATDKYAAAKREREIKGWSHEKKCKLLNGSI